MHLLMYTNKVIFLCGFSTFLEKGWAKKHLLEKGVAKIKH